MVRAMRDKKRVYGCAHRLVWQYFNGDVPAGMCINHKNGNKKDNRPINLEVVSYSDNQKHAHRTGLIDQRGSRNPQSKITGATARRIRRLYATGKWSMIEIASVVGITFQTVGEITSGKIRKTDGGPITRGLRRHRFLGRNAKGQFFDKRSKPISRQFPQPNSA